jgi:class 3 adenylate cyclase
MLLLHAQVFVCHNIWMNRSWEDTAILNTDIAGFTKLSSLLGPEELIPIINCLFSAVDFAAS